MFRGGPLCRPSSRRFRVLVHLSALLLLSMSLAQATHYHGPWISGAKARLSNTGYSADAKDFEGTDSSELTCALCMVSHSVLPSSPAMMTRLNFCIAITPFVFESIGGPGFWSYSLFSRPPPQA
jgi:hypothetical protein